MKLNKIKYLGFNNLEISLNEYFPIKPDIKKTNLDFFNRKIFNSIIINENRTKFIEDYSFIKKDDFSKDQTLLEFRKEFRKMALSEDLEFGKLGKTTELVKQYLKIDKDNIINELQSMGLENIKDKNIIYAIIHTFAHIDYKLVYPAGPVFALAICGVHEDIEIKDFAIQSFEIWENKSSLGYLKAIKVDIPWLKEYLDEIILQIEEM